MTSNNDSRKRRRVTFEEDSDAPPERGRVGGRDREEDHDPLLGRMNEGLSHGAGDDDVSTRHVGEVTGDGRGAPRREDSSPAGSSRQPPLETIRSHRFVHDRDERRPIWQPGHITDGRTVGLVGVGDPGSQPLPESLFYDLVSKVNSRMMGLVAELPRNERIRLGIDGTRWRYNSNWVNGRVPYPPPGALTSTAVVGLFTGTIRERDHLFDFIKLVLGQERAKCDSPTAEAVCVHMPVNSSIAEPDLEAICAAAKSAYTTAPPPAPMERSPTAMHSAAATAREVGDGPGDDYLAESTEPPPLVCDICRRDGTHSTGRCATVTSDRHGDTNTDPFCNWSCSRAHDRHGRATHGLQRSQDAGALRVQIVCAKLAAHWERGRVDVAFKKFVVERRRMAPLLVYTKDFCFIRLAISYSDACCRGQMPEALEGIWPYTKADAIRYKNQLCRFYEIGMENMPAGELEGLSMAEIRARYDTRGGIRPQCRQR